MIRLAYFGDKVTGGLIIYNIDRGQHDPGKIPILDFLWPEPGEISKVPDGYLDLSEEEKKEIRDFIDKHQGPDMDPLTEMIVQLAKDLLQEIH